MVDASSLELLQFAPGQLRSALGKYLPQNASTAKKIAIVEAALRSPIGQTLRGVMAQWIVDEVVPVERLVPEAYGKWRAPVRQAMTFVVSRLSVARLAPKLVEQIELPANTPPEQRLLRLIAKVPGLQKLGQVIARNRHLRPALRRALARLENGIRDVAPADVRAIIQHELGSRLDRFAVRIAPLLLSEASVSAVMRFSWRNPESGRRERGVFKVLKPHIPEYFAEDMDYLQGLAQHFADRRHSYGFPADLLPDTFEKVRRLLKHEVNFVQEQKTLAEVMPLYRQIPGVRVPRLIQPLCTGRITALSEEHGTKVTNAAAGLPATRRRKIAEEIIEGLIAVPLLSAQENAVFHGDPHAGNLLYDSQSDQLTILDWALSVRLTRDVRRHLALLFLRVSLRDPVGASDEIRALSQRRIETRSVRGHMIRKTTGEFLDELPLTSLPNSADAMRLLERVALQGILFPGSLVMLSKVIFTLDGILADVGGSSEGMGFTIARHVAQHWAANRSVFQSPLKLGDWIGLHSGALLFPSRWCIDAERALLNRLFRMAPLTSPATA